jgi:hypothetical protein
VVERESVRAWKCAIAVSAFTWPMSYGRGPERMGCGSPRFLLCEGMPSWPKEPLPLPWPLQPLRLLSALPLSGA